MSGDAFDVIVVGCGAVGSATLAELARRGLRAIGVDRFGPAHGRGSSHGQTRLIRQAYFEHPDYVPLVQRAQTLWDQLAQETGRRLFHQVGLLQSGPAQGVVVPGVRRSAQEHGLTVEDLSPREAMQRWPGFRVPDGWVVAYEPGAGYLRVEASVLAQLSIAERHGARLCLGETVIGWRVEGDGVVVITESKQLRAARLVVAPGAWASRLLPGVPIAWEVRRKPQFWFAVDPDRFRADSGTPAFLFECAQGVFYGFPQINRGDLKVAEHTGGQVVLDPATVDREMLAEERDRVVAFLQTHLPGVGPALRMHSVCLYTMTPDEHFVVDRHPTHSQVVFAAGLSGHGFKFAPVLGEALADLATRGATSLPIGFLVVNRQGLTTCAPR